MKKGTITLEILKEANPKIEVAVEGPLDAKEYFQDRKGLYVYSSFKDKVLGKIESAHGKSEYKIESLDLLRDATDEQIELSLGNKNTFEAFEVADLISALIEKQKNGEDGLLLTNGYANLFYTPACVVDVRWYGSGWDVDAYDRDDYGWVAGYRVFSPQLALDL